LSKPVTLCARNDHKIDKHWSIAVSIACWSRLHQT